MVRSKGFGFTSALLLGACAGFNSNMPPKTLPIEAEELSFVSVSTSDIRFRDQVQFKDTAQRLLSVGYRVRRGGIPNCPTKQTGQFGFTPVTRSLLQKATTRSVAASLTIDQRVSILLVAPGSPAQRAGVEAGDIVDAVNAQELPEGNDGLARLGEVLEKSRASGLPLSLTIRRPDGRFNISIKPEQACAIPVQMLSNREFGGWPYWLKDASVAPESVIALLVAQTLATELLIEHDDRLSAITEPLGEAVDFSLSALSMLLGIVTLGGSGAKEVDIFGHGDTHPNLAAKVDRLAFKIMEQSGYSLTTLREELPSAAISPSVEDTLKRLNEFLTAKP